MYNEVFKKCPNCRDGVGYMQISQIVLGFGNFDLDDPNSLNDLSLEELRELRSAVLQDSFACDGDRSLWPFAEKDDSKDICRRIFWLKNQKRDELIGELTSLQGSGEEPNA